MSSDTLVHHAVTDRVATVTLNSARHNNALSSAVIAALDEALGELSASGEVRALVLTGGECTCFSAGFDIREIDPDQPRDERFPDERLEDAITAVHDFPAPVIAALNGHAFGGGLDLALAADLRVAHPGVKVAMPPAKLGIVYPAEGLMRFLVRLGPQTCRRLFLTAEALEADEAADLGIIDEVVPEEHVLEYAQAMATTIAANAPLAVQGTRRAFQKLEARLGLDPALAEELYALKVGAYTSADLREGLAAFKERRKPDFQGK